MEVKMRRHAPMPNIPGSPAEDCAICKYSLSLFTEPQPVEFHCTLTLVPYEPVTYQDKVVCKRTYSHHLRATSRRLITYSYFLRKTG